MNKIGKRFRVNYDGYISKYRYKIIYSDKDNYIIGFDKDKVCAEDLKHIRGWVSVYYDDRECNRFWCINKNDIVDKYMSIE